MIPLAAGRKDGLRARCRLAMDEGLAAMIDNEVGRFDVRAMTRREWMRQIDYTKNMLFASAAASLTIVGAGAFFLSLWL
ncbi:MAG: hypothetical protein IPK28_19110 [Devosia sp.]|nr:hypothetical protein [Devosia sp.]